MGFKVFLKEATLFTGIIASKDVMEGALSPSSELIGELTDYTKTSSLTGVISSDDIIKGVLSSQLNLTSDLMISHTEEEIPKYEGEYIIVPQPFQDQTLSTARKEMKRNLVVKEIPYFQTSNITGDTVYIGG